MTYRDLKLARHDPKQIIRDPSRNGRMAYGRPPSVFPFHSPIPSTESGLGLARPSGVHDLFTSPALNPPILSFDVGQGGLWMCFEPDCSDCRQCWTGIAGRRGAPSPLFLAKPRSVFLSPRSPIPLPLPSPIEDESMPNPNDHQENRHTKRNCRE